MSAAFRVRAWPVLLLALAAAAVAPAPAAAQSAPLPPSAFFSPDQVAAIEAALRQRALGLPPESRPAVATAPRRLRLGAIVRFGPDRWTIWLNGERVTPANLPPAVQAISVAEGQVVMQWYDARHDAVVPVALRPYQELLLDSGEIRRFDPAAPEGS